MSTANNNSRRACCGLNPIFASDLKLTLETASANCYDFICTPISHPRRFRDLLNPSLASNDPFTRSDLILSSEEWSCNIVAMCSQNIDCDSPMEDRRKLSELILDQELTYASHLAVAMAHITLSKPNNTNLARIINAKMLKGHSSPLWVQVPMVAPSVQTRFHLNRDSQQPEPDTWEWWNSFRCLCRHDKKINAVLEMTTDLPSDEEIARWLGEPVKCIVISTSVFMTNKKGFPVLTKAHQAVLRAFSAVNVQVVISGSLRHESYKHYAQYIDHIFQTLSTVDPLMSYGQGFEDYLQIPLQPLMDNLDSQTYEVFEKDPVKYSEYQRAIYLALLDRVPPEQKDSVTQIVMVVGAGRGPLVNAALNAAQRAERKIRVYAVEKNPNAVITLQAHKTEFWRDSVTIVSCDMREWEAPELADILVSELLGSFGDNELSPECLDGAQKFLKDDGISIPCSYTSYLAPVQNPRLWGEVAARFRDPNKVSETMNFEMPWVVHQQNRYPLAPTQPLFTYHHPNRDKTIDNSRYKMLTFKVENNSMLHGFTGYFDTVLYKDVMLSIEPSTYSRGMVSWFPIFFPIKEPVSLKTGDNLVVHFWRLHNKREVWYEWTITSPITTPIQNPNGRAYNIGL
ncbi:protein arginine N-methyltransferase 5-like [Macrosteles quadrilineatus]|uniref:protein arginine N-methyltransferase 5-like n=1 Tax=Macrosteles quadrilineatus TaxID=74068 RepID=UPI0023E24FA5|nr:protein arginine N-methyltransferase 5-like [Macrosteles quadrilineatus]XP_054290329.1 protein arginine N-methyltransferase 5-like [Macrosteles quadrilineatus]